MKNLLKAKAVLSQGYTCVGYDGKDIITTNERGVTPLVNWLDSGDCFGGYSFADKVVGKAAAFCYVAMGVKKIWATVISKSAAAVFEKYGIEYWYDTIVDAIVNRAGDGFCPMESAVMEIDDPEEAISVVKNKLNRI